MEQSRMENPETKAPLDTSKKNKDQQNKNGTEY
jgi:hypothetical protein